MTTDNPREATDAVTWLDLDRNPHASVQMLLWYAPQTVAALKEWLAVHPLSGGGVGSPGALPLGTEQGEETPTPPPASGASRRSVASTCLCECGCEGEQPCGCPCPDHPTPPPLTVDREQITDVLREHPIIAMMAGDIACGCDDERWLEADEYNQHVADAVVAELAAGRTVIELTSDLAERLGFHEDGGGTD